MCSFHVLYYGDVPEGRLKTKTWRLAFLVHIVNEAEISTVISQVTKVTVVHSYRLCITLIIIIFLTGLWKSCSLITYWILVSDSKNITTVWEIIKYIESESRVLLEVKFFKGLLS